MSVVVSLLRAIDRADGEALVMHVGEKPYVVTAGGHAELASKELTIPAMTGMLDQLLPADSRHALEELGAVEYHLPEQHEAPGMRYSIVAARGGDDIWIEVRRRKEEPPPPAVTELPVVSSPDDGLDLRQLDVALEHEPEPVVDRLADQPVTLAGPADYTIETSGPVAIEEPEQPAATEVPVILEVPEPEFEPILLVAPEAEAAPTLIAVPEPEPQPELDLEALPVVAPEAAAINTSQPALDASLLLESDANVAPAFPLVGDYDPEPDTFLLVAPEPESGPALVAESEAAVAPTDVVPELAPEPLVLQQEVAAIADAEPAVIDEPAQAATEDTASSEPSVIMAESAETAAEAPVASQPVAQEPLTPHGEPTPQLPELEPEDLDARPQHHSPVVVPLTRATRHEAPARPHVRGEGLPHLLHVAASQGASVLYVAAQAKPSLRVDGEIRVLDHETPLTEAQLEAGMLAIFPGLAKVADGEMPTCDVQGVGRVQVLSFHDHRGLGAMFRMLPARAISSEQMGLGAPIQALCTETEGLLLVAGVRGSGKSTLTAALVDQINRTRRDHVITVEQQIQFVHDNRQSFVSQREARDEEAFAAAVRSALREGPDVLVIDQVTSTETASFALHAAATGHLVIASVTAPTTSTALGRFVDFFGEERTHERATLAEHLRGVVTQSLLRKAGGGRAAAREVLVNVPSVAALIAEGAFDQLGTVLNGGRRVGMVPLNDALLGLVQSGALDVREAYRKSPDQHELVTMLNRAGLDTTFAERLA